MRKKKERKKKERKKIEKAVLCYWKGMYYQCLEYCMETWSPFVRKAATKVEDRLRMLSKLNRCTEMLLSEDK